MSTRFASMLALAAATAFAAGSALAEKPSWAGHGKAKHEKHAEKHKESADVKVGAFFNDDHRGKVRTYYGEQYTKVKACPPGLAKKNNGCMPPGQAKKLVVGQPIPAGTTFYTVPQTVIVQLPPVPPGYRYVRVGNDVILMSPQSQVIVDIISGLFG